MAVVIDEYTFYTALFLLLIAGRTVNSQGGALIVFWRIIGRKWFLHTQIGPDGNTTRKALPMKIVKTHSVPTYEFQGKEWFVGGEDETARIYGGPQWVYRYNDARPLPLRQIESKMVEVKEKMKEADGTEREVTKMVPMVVAGKPIDPTLINAAWRNKSIEAFNKLGDKPNKFRWGLLGFVIAVIFIITAFNLLYTYYYGVNIACAVHAQGVQCH